METFAYASLQHHLTVSSIRPDQDNDDIGDDYEWYCQNINRERLLDPVLRAVVLQRRIEGMKEP